MNKSCLRVAVVGIGGFGYAHHLALIDLEKAGLVKVVATCDPRAAWLVEEQLRYRFKDRGVAVYADFPSLLAAHGNRLDFVSIVSPMLFHAEQHRACVENGIACYLEKPPTLDPNELEQMIAVERGARFATQVGFNFISQPWRQALKKRLIAGEFGTVRRVGFKGLWRRSQAYFGRNSWAGSLLVGDSIVTDSCCGNAMAHFLHNLLFHAGTGSLMSWASPQSVQAELYRANRIEGADTVFAKGVLDNGVEFHIAVTHACEPFLSHVELIQCDRAEIEIREEGPFTIRYEDGTFEVGMAPSGSLRENLQKYWEYLTGRQRRPSTLLEDCRAFVQLNALFYIAAGKIKKLRPPHAEAKRVDDDPKDTFCVPGIEQVCGDFLRLGQFPSQSDLPWGAAGGRAFIGQLPELRRALVDMRNGDPLGRVLEDDESRDPLAALKD